MRVCLFVCLFVCLARVAQFVKANRRVEEEKLADLKEKQKEAEVEKALWEERQASLGGPSLARAMSYAARRARRGVGA